MYLDNKRVFLAGATGSVGTAILAHLIERYPAVRIRAAVQPRNRTLRRIAWNTSAATCVHRKPAASWRGDAIAPSWLPRVPAGPRQ